MPLIKKCECCGDSFRTKPSYVELGWGKYCSRACHHKKLKKGKVLFCDLCNAETYKSPKSLKRSKSKKFFCTKSCQTKWRNVQYIQEKHPNWKGGRYAYRSVLSRYKIKPQCRLCHTVDERVLAVHHIDENRKNNRVENLSWLCHNCHHLVHRYADVREKFMVLIV
jgi:hypothetical protein